MGKQDIQRSKVITVRVTEDENELIRELAKKNEFSLSDYLRTRALGGRIAEPKLSKAQAQEIIQTLIKIEGELGHHGSNINQIVKLAHISSSEQFYKSVNTFIEGEEIEALERSYEVLRHEVTKVWQQLQ